MNKIKDFIYWNIINPIFFYRLKLPRIKRKYMKIKDISFWANRLQELHFGQIVIGKIQFIINLVILLKVFDAPTWSYIVCFILGSFFIWYIGRILEKSGMRKYFQKAQLKDVLKQ